jgi:hypothetical protein
MPSVIDTPVRVDHDTHDLQEEQPQVRVARSGFWHRLVQYVRRHRVHTSFQTRSSGHSARCQMESPMVRLAQEHPTLYLLGFCGIHTI